MAGRENEVEIDEEVRYTEEETKAIEQFIFAINSNSCHGKNRKKIDRETAVKFLMARKFDKEKAKVLFDAHMTVCEKFELDYLNPFQEKLSVELLSGKFTVLFGKDLTGSSVCLFTEKLHFPKKTTHAVVLKSLIFQLNELMSRHDAQRKGIVLIYDMTKAAYRNFDYDLCMKTLRILKGAFPAKLKHVYILSAPLWFRASLSILSNFVGEKITSRVELLKKSQDLLTRIPASTLPLHLGGTCEHSHDMWLEMCVSNYLRNAETQTQADSELGKGFAKSKSFSDRLREAAEEEQEKETIRHDHRLNIDDLVSYVDSVGKQGIYNEYQCIHTMPPHGEFKASRHPFNGGKNRYRDVPCYDHSRVKLKILDEDDFSDYINASFVDGYSHPKAYICTQGPLQNTAYDFWRMILEQKPTVILMLSRCYEMGREKCFRYWPDEAKVLRFKSVTIQNLGIVESDDYIASNLEVYMEGAKSSQRVTHFQFLGWPDYGVPSSADRLLDIMSQVHAFQNLTIDKDGPGSSAQDPHSVASAERGPSSTNKPPLVVHCSAGIGRTGTFISIDITLQEFDAMGTVDIQNTVQHIRRQRALSVQTGQQYAFCYASVLEYCLRANRNGASRKIKRCFDRFRKDSLYSD